MQSHHGQTKSTTASLGQPQILGKPSVCRMAATMATYCVLSGLKQYIRSTAHTIAILKWVLTSETYNS